jgi:hypothetical protein
MEDGKGVVLAEFMRSLSRALLPELGTREREGGEQREQEGKTAKRTWTYTSWPGLVIYRPPSLPQAVLPTTMTRIWRKE